MIRCSPTEFPFEWFRQLPTQKRGAGNPRTKSKFVYKDIITAFDIETTRIEEIEQSVMYIWQWSFGTEYCVVGRTWDEFREFCDIIQLAMKDKERLCIFVHNLSFEFFYLRGIFRFSTDDVFCVKPRKILRAQYQHFEWRCSYLHANMALKEYLKKMGTPHQKLPDYEYTGRRWWYTPLTDSEMEYCVNDVLGLVEAIQIEMAADGDNLYTFPLTSTGYVRRDAKHAMRKVSYSFVQNQLPDYVTYCRLREAFRGGDVHANRHFAGQIVRRGHSADRSSSYPDIVCNDPFPISAFRHEPRPLTFDEIMELITKYKKAVLMRVCITGLSLRDPDWPAPYLSTDKCDKLKDMLVYPAGEDTQGPPQRFGVEKDNGRLLECGYLESTITDVDLRILVKEYQWRDIVFEDVYHARYGKLPRPLVEETIRYYRMKTELKNVAGQEVYYTKSKNKLNSIYGMMAQNIAKLMIKYYQDGVLDKYGYLQYFAEDKSKTEEQILEKNRSKLFLCYQWGVWVTAWARYRLHEGIWLVTEQGGDFLYCDTDSIKYLGDVDWSSYNNARIKASKESGAFAADPFGEMHYMGVFEIEQDFLCFKTWGAKKYCYTVWNDKKQREELHSTIAGVAKSAGAAELVAAGVALREAGSIPKDVSDAEAGIYAFAIDFTFIEAGGLEAIYNDDPPMHEYVNEDGQTIVITPNVNLRPSTYTLGIAGDYERLLKNRVYDDIDI